MGKNGSGVHELEVLAHVAELWGLACIAGGLAIAVVTAWQLLKSRKGKEAG
jgi:hypothetical protein